MILLTSNNNDIIIFECKNLYEDMGLLLVENKNKKDELFELHLYNSYTSDSMMITLNIKDLAKLCSALSGYLKNNRSLDRDGPKT